MNKDSSSFLSRSFILLEKTDKENHITIFTKEECLAYFLVLEQCFKYLVIHHGQYFLVLEQC